MGEQPQEPDKSTYQRDKSAKDPAKKDAPATPPKPKIKPRKVFQAKKVKIQSSKPMEHRARHILVSTEETAKFFRQQIVDFHNELSEMPSDDPDREFTDWEKVERFFVRIAKKYSTCRTKALGGDLDWVYSKMALPETMNEELLKALMEAQSFSIPEAVKSPLGFHIILVAEKRILKQAVPDKKEEVDPRYQALAAKDNPNIQAPKGGSIPT